ncbi:uncharacterized protein LOC121392212 [Gigantopelta aegis]|uniref:uncharacterized protein LOC121392212 n=1 Tax=Gigantopelta aegis TaxID=1735272 RepID=UPI001B888E78|nr:uncharacterized protein LOC121392212 [Gigantopelta aegis]
MSTCRILAMLVVLAVFSHRVHSQMVIPCNRGSEFCGHPGHDVCPQDSGHKIGFICENGAPCCIGYDPCLWAINCNRPSLPSGMQFGMRPGIKVDDKDADEVED